MISSNCLEEVNRLCSVYRIKDLLNYDMPESNKNTKNGKSMLNPLYLKNLARQQYPNKATRVRLPL